MMLRLSLGLEREAQTVGSAVQNVLANGSRTADITDDGLGVLSTKEMGDAVAKLLMEAQ